MRSFAERAVSIRGNLDLVLVEKRGNRNELTKLLRRSQSARQAGARGKRTDLTTRSPDRFDEDLCKTWNRSRRMAVPVQTPARRIHQRSHRHNDHDRERSATGPEGFHNGTRTETLLSRSRPRYLLL